MSESENPSEAAALLLILGCALIFGACAVGGMTELSVWLVVALLGAGWVLASIGAVAIGVGMGMRQAGSRQGQPAKRG